MPKAKKENESSDFTDFKIMLHVDESGTAHYPGATGYYDALTKCEQRKGYSMAGEREKDMIKEFDRQQGISTPEPVPEPTKKSDITELEERYGDMFRKLRHYKGVSAEQLAKQFGLKISDVKTILRSEKHASNGN